MKANSNPTIKAVQNAIAAEIKRQIDATVEVVCLKDHFMIYSENLEAIQEIKRAFNSTYELLDESYYEADEDLPAAINVKFAYAN